MYLHVLIINARNFSVASMLVTDREDRLCFRCQRTICDVGDRSTQRKNQHNVTNYHHNVTNITISKIFRIEPF